MNGEGSVRGSLQAKFGTVANMPLYIERRAILYLTAAERKSIFVEFLPVLNRQHVRGAE